MKRQIQLRGERDWAGDDLIDLQNEPIKAIDAIFAPYAACVLSGCTISPNGANYNVAAGYVSLKGTSHENKAVSVVVPFAGVEASTLPIYLTLRYETVTDIYGDGAIKPIAYDYTAIASTVKPIEAHLEISTTAKTTFLEVIQGDERLFMSKTEREKLQGIAANANKYIHPDDTNTRHVSDSEKTTWNGKAAGDHNHDDKYKNYVHPNDSNTRHVTDSEKATWNGKADANHGHGVSYIAGTVRYNGNGGVDYSINQISGEFSIEEFDASGYMGKYKITHNIGTLKYHIDLQFIYGVGSIPNGIVISPVIYTQTANYVEIGFDVYDEKVEPICGPRRIDFNFMITVFE